MSGILSTYAEVTNTNSAEVMNWLEGIERGWSERFGHVFEKFGVEDLSDMREIHPDDLKALEELLKESGATPLQLQKIRRHVCGLRISFVLKE